MSYALVIDNGVQSEGPLPASARRLDTGQYVMSLPTVALQEACGYFLVKTTARPADTATETYDRSVTFAAGVATETWSKRDKTQGEIDNASTAANHSSIITNLNQDMDKMQATIDATNATINANPATFIKDIARMNRRLGRLALSDLDGST
jgi:hypothetical protein